MKANTLSFTRVSLFTTLTVLAILSPRSSFAGNETQSGSPQNSQVNRASLEAMADKFKKPASPTLALEVSELRKAPDLKSIKSTLMGTKDGGGGDDLALEFQNAAKRGLQDLKDFHPEVYQGLAAADMDAVIENAEVIIVDDALDVKTKDLIQSSVAVNFPEEQTVLINRTKWANIPSPELGKKIALHEFLSLKGFERTGYYPISSKLISEMSMRRPVKQQDEGAIPTVVYSCGISNKNMIGIGIEYQVLLTLNATQVSYSEYSEGNVGQGYLYSNVRRTRQNFPAYVKNQGSRYYIQARLYNTEDAGVRDEEMILDTQKLTLELAKVGSSPLSVSCKLKYRQGLN